MLMLSLVVASFGVMLTEEESNPEAKFDFMHCTHDIIMKIGKTWMHYMVMLSMHCKKLKINIYAEILLHFGVFCIATFLSQSLSVYGQLALVELSSIFFFSFLDIVSIFCYAARYYLHIGILVGFYFLDCLLFMNYIPHSIATVAIFAMFHVISLGLAAMSKQHRSKTAESLPLVYDKVINVGEYSGKYCVIVQISEQKCIQLLRFGTEGKHEVMKEMALPKDYAMLRAYHEHSKLILVQARNMLYLYTLPHFKLVKLYDMGNEQVDTAESIRIRPALKYFEEQSPVIGENQDKEKVIFDEFSTPENQFNKKINDKDRSQSIDDVHLRTTAANLEIHTVVHPTEPECASLNSFRPRNDIDNNININQQQQLTEEQSPVQKRIETISPVTPITNISPPSCHYQKKNSCYFMLNEDNPNVDSSAIASPQDQIFANSSNKLYITHESNPLVAEICTVGSDTQIRIINYLKNFEERRLLITMPIKHQYQLLQFIRIDESDKIFFKSEVNSYCLIDINKNISEIVRQRADDQIQCSIINEREIILGEQDFLYLYDIPASLFVKKISPFYRNSHILPILNAPGFYIIIPSPAHCQRISPVISQLINHRFAHYLQLVNQNYHSLHIQKVIYDQLNQQLFIFTSKHVCVQKNVHLPAAVQPLVLDHVILDVSIYQQQSKDFF